MDTRALVEEVTNRPRLPIICSGAGSRLLPQRSLEVGADEGADLRIWIKLDGVGHGSAGMPRMTREKYVFARGAAQHGPPVEWRLMNPNATRIAGGLWSKALFAPLDRRPAVQHFVAERGCQPPWLMVIRAPVTLVT